MSEGLLSSLWQRASAEIQTAPASASHIRAIWQTRYAMKLTEDDVVHELTYLLIQTDAYGCAYVSSEDFTISDLSRFLSRSVFDVRTEGRIMQIAALDSFFGSIRALRGTPEEVHIISGANHEKSHKRALLVVQEALRLAKYRVGRPLRALLIGVVGSILNELLKIEDWEVSATDFSRFIVGRKYGRCEVEHGSRTLDDINHSDIVIATGMTLSTGSLDAIVQGCTSHGVPLLLFSQTGANFGHEYTLRGIDAVISEPHPFYLSSDGPSEIRVFRRPE